MKQLQEKYSKIVEKNEGDIVKLENWGLMNLSYLIKKIKKVITYILKLKLMEKLFLNLEKNEKIDKNLLRYLTVKVKKFDLDTDYFKKNSEDKEVDKKIKK